MERVKQKAANEEPAVETSVSPSDRRRSELRGRPLAEQQALLTPANAVAYDGASGDLGAAPMEPVGPSKPAPEKMGAPEPTTETLAAAPVAASDKDRVPVKASFRRGFHQKFQDLEVPAGKFGGTQPHFLITEVDLKDAAGGKSDKAGSHWAVSARIDMQSSWQVPDSIMGKKNISSADSPLLDDEAKARSAASDLRPSLSPDGKPAREKHWNRDITVRHENFHMADFWGWLESTGLPYAARALNKLTVTGSSMEKAYLEIRKFVDGIEGDLKTMWANYYNAAGDDETQSKCEETAYADGKKSYVDLADAIVKKHLSK